MSSATVEFKPGGSTWSEPGRPAGLLENVLEGAAAALCAVIAMVAVSALALWLLDAGSVGSLWSLAMTVTAMSVGGSVTPVAAGPGSEGSGLEGLLGGGLSPSLSGTVDVMPLGVSLVGALVLWMVFSWRMRRVRFGVGELLARTAGTAVVALFGFLVVAHLARGALDLPASAMSSLRGADAGSGGLGSAGPDGGSSLGGLLGERLGGLGERLGERLGGLDGGSQAGQAMNYQVQSGSAALGAVLWVVVVIALGFLITRRAHLPVQWATSRLRVSWAPSVSAVVRMFLVMTVVLLLSVLFVGVLVGGKAVTAAGAAVLLAPNAVVVFLSLGVGASWTASTHQVQSQGGNPLASLLQLLGGQQSQARPDRVEHLRDLSAGGRPLWLVALLVSAVALLACGYAAARDTDQTQIRFSNTHQGRFGQHLAPAGRLGIVVGVFLGLASWVVQADGQISASIFGSEMGGMHAELSGSVPMAFVLGLVAGAMAGFVGSLLFSLSRGRQTNPVSSSG
jgi:hypothetical protein